MDFSFDGYCGLYCGACPIMLRSKAATEPNPCYGCKSERIAAGRHCATCDIKACARQRGLAFCHECTDLEACEKMTLFMADPQWPYHQGVRKNMGMIQREGVAKWLEVQEKRWQCENCGTSHSWWDETCPRCGQAVRNYQADL